MPDDSNDIFSALNSISQGSGDEAQQSATAMPLASETNADASARQYAADTATRQWGRVKAADLESRGIPSFTDPTGNVKPYTDDTGAALTNSDPKSGVAYDSAGRAVTYTSRNPTRTPVVQDAYANAPKVTDKQGNIYAQPHPSTGLPPMWTGTDPDVAAQYATDQTAKLNQQTSTAMAPFEQQAKIATAQSAKAVKASVKNLSTTLTSNGAAITDADGDPIDLIDVDGPTLKGAISDAFDKQYAAPEANETPWLGGGKYTSSAAAIRQSIDQRKQSAMAAADSHIDTLTQHQTNLDNLTQIQQQRAQLEAQRLDTINQQRQNQGLAPVSIPGLEHLDNSGQPAAAPTDAGAGATQSSAAIPGLEGAAGASAQDASNPPKVTPEQAQANLEEARNGNKPYSYDEAKGVQFKQENIADGLQQAVKDGVVDPKWAADHQQQFQDVQDKYKALITAAGDNDKLKAVLHGAGLGAAFWAGSIPGAKAGATAAALIPGVGETGVAELVGAALGGLTTGTIAAWAAHKALDKLADYSTAVKSLNASAEIHPVLDAAGQFVGMSLNAPKAIANISNVARIAADVGVDVGTVKTVQRVLSSPEAWKAAGKIAGTGAATGLVFEGGVRPLFDVAKNSVLDQLGIQHDAVQPPTVSSLIANAALGIISAGHNIEFKDYSAADVASILIRAKMRNDAGIPLDSNAPADVVNAFQSKGITLDPSKTSEMTRPLTAQEKSVYDALAKKTAQMQAEGKFDDATGVQFKGAKQAIVRTLGKDGQPITSAAVEAEHAPQGEPGATSGPPATPEPPSPTSGPIEPAPTDQKLLKNDTQEAQERRYGKLIKLGWEPKDIREMDEEEQHRLVKFEIGKTSSAPQPVTNMAGDIVREPIAEATRMKLADAGYSPNDIDSMSVEDAHRLAYPREPIQQPQTQIDTAEPSKITAAEKPEPTKEKSEFEKLMEREGHPTSVNQKYTPTGDQPKQGHRHVGSPEDEAFQKAGGGWKLHLAVDPKNYKAVDDWLEKNHPAQYKLLSGGEPGESDFTVYVGGKNEATALASKIHAEIGDKLNTIDRSGPQTDISFGEKVSGRFDPRGKQNSWGTGGTNYGREGLPYDDPAKEAMQQARLAKQSGDTEAEAGWRKIVGNHEERIRRELTEKYGERFTGSGGTSTAPEEAPLQSQSGSGTTGAQSGETSPKTATAQQPAPSGIAPNESSQQVQEPAAPSQPESTPNEKALAPETGKAHGEAPRPEVQPLAKGDSVAIKTKDGHIAGQVAYVRTDGLVDVKTPSGIKTVTPQEITKNEPSKTQEENTEGSLSPHGSDETSQPSSGGESTPTKGSGEAKSGITREVAQKVGKKVRNGVLKPQFDLLKTKLYDVEEGTILRETGHDGSGLMVDQKTGQIWHETATTAKSMQAVEQNVLKRNWKPEAARSLAERWLREAISEELIHTRQVAFNGVTTDAVYGKLWRESVPEQARIYVRAIRGGDKASDAVLGAEYERMLIQYRETGTITEAQDGNREHEDIWEGKDGIPGLKSILHAKQQEPIEQSVDRILQLTADRQSESAESTPPESAPKSETPSTQTERGPPEKEESPLHASKPEEFKADMRQQGEWMEQEAKARGFGSLSELSKEEPGSLKKLASQWRSFHARDAEGTFLQNEDAERINGLLYGHQNAIPGLETAHAGGRIAGTSEALRDAIKVARGNERAGGSSKRDRWKEGERLEQWARANGLLIESLPEQFTPDSKEDKGGLEHSAFAVPEAHRWLKVTRNAGVSMGRTPHIANSGFSLEEATPLEYLERLRDWNTLIGDDIRLHGFLFDGKSLDAITSQPDIAGEKASDDEIDRAFESAGFKKFASPGGYYRKRGNTAVFDIHQQNAVKNGDTLIAFDGVVIHPDEEMRDHIEEEIFSQRAQQARALHAAKPEQVIPGLEEETIPGLGKDEQHGRASVPEGTPTLHAKNATITGPSRVTLHAAKPIVAHHGTPHEVDRFTTDKIGTGEGAQAYGWGLYFAENPAVSKDYAKALSDGKAMLDGKMINSRSTDDPVKKWAEQHVEGAASSVAINGADFKENLEGRIKRELGRPARDQDFPQVQGAKLAKEWLDAGKLSLASGNEYTVKVKPSEEEFLDWDLPLSRQSKKIQSALSKLDPDQYSKDGNDYDENEPGQVTYQRLWETLIRSGKAKPASEKREEASKKLLSLGIKGIRYDDQGSRGKTTWIAKHPQGGIDDFPDEKTARAFAKRNPEVALIPPKGTKNYVIFDENDIEITHKNGEPVGFEEALHASKPDTGAPGESDIPSENLVREAEAAGVILKTEELKGLIRSDNTVMDAVRTKIKARTGKDALFAAKPMSEKGFALGGEDSHGKKRVMTFPAGEQGYHAWDSTNHPGDARNKKWRFKNGTLNWVQHEPDEVEMEDAEALLAQHGLKVVRHKDWATGESITPKRPEDALFAAKPLSEKLDYLTGKSGIDAAQKALKLVFDPGSILGEGEKELRRQDPNYIGKARRTEMDLNAVTANMDRRKKQWELTLNEARELVQKLPDAQKLELMKRVDEGTSLKPGPYKAAFDKIAKLDADRTQDMKDWFDGMGRDDWQNYENFLKNIVPHYFADANQAAKVTQQYIDERKKMSGSGGFLKHRAGFTMRELMDWAETLGIKLEPKHANVIDAIMDRWTQQERYRGAHTLMEAMAADGRGHWENTDYIPRGEQRKVSNIVGRRHKDGHWQEFYTDAPSAQIINNYLSRGLRDNQLVNNYFQAANALNGLQLGVSGFHAGFVTVEGMVSTFSLGLQKILAGDMKGFADVMKAPFSTISDYMLGKKIQKEMLHPGSMAPDLTAVVNAMVMSGYRQGVDSFYHDQHIKAMFDAFRGNHAVKGALRAPFALIELLAKPIMEFYVPYMKAAAIYKLAEMHIKQSPSISATELQDRLNKDVASGNNRFGQMTYDNLHMHKTVKDILMGLVRSLGWTWGTFSELGGGITDWLSWLKNMAFWGGRRIGGGGNGNGGNAAPGANGGANAGKMPRITNKMAYVLALPLLIGLFGAVLSAMFGKKPKTLKDYYFVQTGDIDDHGNPVRLVLPSYMKDMFHAAAHPLTTITNKLHPLLSMISQMLQNKDFYNIEIRHSGDPIMKQALQELAYVGKQIEPFSIRNLQKQTGTQTSMGTKIAGAFGITQAPSSAGKTKAEELAGELVHAQIPDKSRTQSEADHSALVSQLTGLQRVGKGQQLMQQSLAAGKINARDVAKIMKNSSMTALQVSVNRLGLSDAEKVADVANPQEKTQLRTLIAAKAQRAGKPMMFTGF